MNKGFADIFMEPFLARFPDIKYSYLIELKYISISDYSEKILNQKIDAAKKQLDQYVKSERIIKSIENTQLKKIILVYKGWELDYFDEIN